MLTINIIFVLSLTSILFFIGLIGIAINRKNILIIIMSIELMLLAVNLNFAAFSIYLDDVYWANFCFVCFNSCCSRISDRTSIDNSFL